MRYKMFSEVFLLTLEFSDMTNAIVNHHCTEPGQAHPVSTAHPALKRYVCLPSVVIWAPADTT